MTTLPDPDLTQHDAALVDVWLGAVLEVTVDATVVHPSIVAAQRGEAVHLVTAYNPQGEARGAADNARADDDLVLLLDARSIDHVAALGRSPDGSWAEPGWCLIGIERAEACGIGVAFGQLAIYEVTAHDTHVVWCTNGSVIASTTAS